MKYIFKDGKAILIKADKKPEPKKQYKGELEVASKQKVTEKKRKR